MHLTLIHRANIALFDASRLDHQTAPPTKFVSTVPPTRGQKTQSITPQKISFKDTTKTYSASSSQSHMSDVSFFTMNSRQFGMMLQRIEAPAPNVHDMGLLPPPVLPPFGWRLGKDLDDDTVAPPREHDCGLVVVVVLVLLPGGRDRSMELDGSGVMLFSLSSVLGGLSFLSMLPFIAGDLADDDP